MQFCLAAPTYGEATILVMQIADDKPMGCRFTFGAHIENIDTEEKLSNPELLDLLDGITESSAFADYLHESDLTSSLRVRGAIPTLRFDKAKDDLFLEIVFETDRRPRDQRR